MRLTFLLPNLYQVAMRGCMLAGSDRASPNTTRFDSPNDTSASSRLGRYGKAAGFLLIFPAALLDVKGVALWCVRIGRV